MPTTPARHQWLPVALSACAILAWAPASHSQAVTTQHYADPSGLFTVTVPAEWKINRTEDANIGVITRFYSDDQSSILTIISTIVPSDLKLPPGKTRDDMVADVSPRHFEGYRGALANTDNFEGLETGPKRKEEFQGRPCIRQDFNFRRKGNPERRRSSAYFFFAENTVVFLTVSGTVDGAKIAADYMKTFKAGKVDASMYQVPGRQTDGVALTHVYASADEARKAIASLEVQWANNPSDLKIMRDLHSAYVDIQTHYLDKSRSLGLSIAAESLRSMRIPPHDDMPDPTDANNGILAKVRASQFQSLARYQESTKLGYMPTSRMIIDGFAYDVVSWIEKGNLRTKLDRERSARLLEITVGLYAVMDKHFAEVRAKQPGASLEESDFTAAERGLRDQMQKSLARLTAGRN